MNSEEVQVFLQKDPKATTRLWSDDFVVTNPLNRFANIQQVLGMVESGFLVITCYDRQIEYARVYCDTAIVAGVEMVLWAAHWEVRASPLKQWGRWQQVVRHANIVPQQ